MQIKKRKKKVLLNIQEYLTSDHVPDCSLLEKPYISSDLVVFILLHKLFSFGLSYRPDTEQKPFQRLKKWQGS